MNVILEFLITIKNTVFSVFSEFGFFDIIDVIVLTFLIYKGIIFCRDTRAKTLLKGIALVMAMYALSSWFGMTGLNFLLESLVNYALVVLVIIFQPELRHMLEKVGHSSFSLFGKNIASVDQDKINCINEVCKAVNTMSEQKIGALIVFENKTPLGEIINTGTTIESILSAPMISNIFFPKSPLHDGAMIIRDNRIQAAGCILPLTSNQDISLDLGTRHRAAIGMSENSDSVTIVVSEETGTISLTRNGTITRGFNSQSLQQELYTLFVDSEEKDNSLLNSVLSIFKKKEKEDGENE